jgi:hypothetical protein
MELSMGKSSVPTLKIDALKDRKSVFKDDVLINDNDALRFKQYIQENLGSKEQQSSVDNQKS